MLWGNHIHIDLRCGFIFLILWFHLLNQIR